MWLSRFLVFYSVLPIWNGCFRRKLIAALAVDPICVSATGSTVGAAPAAMRVLRARRLAACAAPAEILVNFSPQKLHRSVGTRLVNNLG